MTSRRNNSVPQTVEAALQNGWTYIKLRCAMCRHAGKIELNLRRGEEPLAQIARQARCTQCGKTGWVDAHIGVVFVTQSERSIRFEGNRTMRIGMN
jgi:uncharacterized protein with PIN domain